MTRYEELAALVARLHDEIDGCDMRMDAARTQLEDVAAAKKAVMDQYSAACSELQSLRPPQPGDVVIAVPNGSAQ